MDFNLYIKEYYEYLLVFICLLTTLSFFVGINKKNKKLIGLLTIVFSGLMVVYMGGRDLSIGVDTLNYYKGFLTYKGLDHFVIRNDPFFDLITYIFATYFNYRSQLYFCAFLYVFGAWYGLRKLFGHFYYIPFLFFLISPYFVAWGVNVMRNGIAASLFLICIGAYYQKEKKWKVVLWGTMSVLFHISMIVPIIAFVLSYFIKNTKLIFMCWLGAIFLGYVHINIIEIIVGGLDNAFADRADNYISYGGERNGWSNFITFGIIPVLFGVYNVLVAKYDNKFYKWLLNAYLIAHIPYIVLLDTQFALRLGYLAEFMMPILLFFPLLVDSKFKIKFLSFKLSLLILCVFVIKAFGFFV